MKISEMFDLNKSQYELDFVDIDPNIDTPLFLDPYYIAKCEFPFAEKAHETIRSYFEFLLALLRGDQIAKARELFSYLGETNDICMGMSADKPSGHGMGPKDTLTIFKSLSDSRAILTGVMEDIEDFRIFVPNVDKDKVSDMTANIIKWHLIEYTKEQCDLHGIPLSSSIPTGYFWNKETLLWENKYAERLVIANRPILLVPKRIVSFTDKYTPTEYKQHFVLNFLQNEHLQMNSALVQKRKDGRRYVTKKSIEENELPIDKAYLTNFTLMHPEIFKQFRDKTKSKLRPMNGAMFSNDINLCELCSYLAEKLKSTPCGNDSASAYHTLIVGILELLLYPNLSNPKKEQQIHQGRKRIDITYNNSAETGFFFRLPNHDRSLTCSFIFVECKNYSGEVANPELDQLSGRFSARRGRVGILACRNLDSSDGFMKRCADTYHDDRGLILPLCDDDLLIALEEYPQIGTEALENILESKLRQIVFEDF
ncbi:MAG: hypothetical protein E7316_08310 [Clostridiales bacterium]|nr:hypothetical protein [Clostridiales bacterium]